MTTGGAIIKLGVIAGGVWAYRNGYFDSLIDAARGAAQPQARPAASMLFDVPEVPVPAPVAASLRLNSGGSKEFDLLTLHWADVQPWARRNKSWAAAMMWQESRGNTDAVSSAGARGLMQVMPATMGDLHRWGWDRYPADAQSLHRPNVGIYFGTAYLEYLHKTFGRDREWMTRAYNAGPGGQRSNGTWPAETVNYLEQIKRQYARIT